jgi:glycopeptide antibiotics resistance protein
LGPNDTAAAQSWARTFLAARVGYVGLVFLATLSQLHVDPNPLEISERLARALSPSLSLRDAVDGARNVALFAGLGVVWLVTDVSGRVWSAARSATIAGCALSVVVEALQLLSPVRTSSLLDVATNTGGALVGALVVIGLALVVRSFQGQRTFIGVPAFLFGGAYAGVVALEAFAPLLRQQRFNVEGSPLDRLRTAIGQIEPGSLFAVPFSDVGLFLPAGALAVAALVELGGKYKSAWWQVALGGAVLSILAEFLHGMAGRPIVYGAILAHTAGIALGAVAAAVALPRLTPRLRGGGRAAAFLGTYALIVLVWAWRPFRMRTDTLEIATEMSVRRLVPMLAYTERIDLFSIVDVAIPFLLFLPLGSFLAVWPLHRGGPFGWIWPALYLAAVGEIGQVLVAGRFFDATDLLIQVSGAFVGWIIARRSGYEPRGELLPDLLGPERRTRGREGGRRAG